MPKLKRKKSKKSKKAQEKGEVSLDLSTSFNVADAKDEDFELDLDNAKYQGKKGQAGTRQKSD